MQLPELVRHAGRAPIGLRGCPEHRVDLAMELGAQLLDPAIDEVVEARGGRARILRGSRCSHDRGGHHGGEAHQLVPGACFASSGAGAKTVPIRRNFS